MKQRIATSVAVVVFLFAAMFGLSFVPQSSTAQAPAHASQRYSMSTVPFKDGFYTVVCDTSTGKCWAKYGVEGEGKSPWFDIGGPEK